MAAGGRTKPASNARAERRRREREAAKAAKGNGGPPPEPPSEEPGDGDGEGAAPQLNDGIFVGMFATGKGGQPDIEYLCVGDVRPTEAVFYLSKALAKARKLAEQIDA